jgi:hypothetical protein
MVSKMDILGALPHHLDKRKLLPYKEFTLYRR